jgi:uncharacterized membrane protein
MQFLVLALLPLAVLVVLIVLIAKTTSNSTKIGNLEWEIKKLHDLERHVNELNVSIDALQKQLEDVKPSASRRKELEPEKIASPQMQETAPRQSFNASTVSEQMPTRQPSQPPTPSRTREEWEALIGGKLLNRIGALALIIGIGFFLKYAFDNNWISETTRVLTGVAIGMLCLFGGYRTNKRGYEVFAQGMGGAGIAILYLSVYAAFNFYQLLPQWVAFVFMAIVTVIALLNGLFYNSLAEAVLGWAGGFLTPLLLSTGHANEVGLFTYLVLLDAGLVAMAVKRDKWAILEPLAFVGTWLMYATWRAEYYTGADLWMTVFFVTAFWALFLAPDVLRSRIPGPGDRFQRIVATVNAAFYFLAMYFLINDDHHAWMGLITLVIGAAYFSVFLAQQRRGDLRSDAKIQYTLTAAALLVIATSIQFSNFGTVIFWSVEAAVLVWCSKEWKEEYVLTAALVLFGLAVSKLLFATEGALMYAPIRDYSALFNRRALAFTALAGSLGFGAFVLDRSSAARTKNVSDVLHAAWCLILFLLVSAETNDFFRFTMLDQPAIIWPRLEYFRVMTYGVVWTTFSLPLVWVGLKKKLPALIISGLICALLAVVFGVVRGIAYDPISSYVPLFNGRAIALLLVLTGLMLQTQFIQKTSGDFDWLKNILAVVQAAMVLVFFVLVTGETRDFFQKDIAALAEQAGGALSEAGRLANMQQMSLSGVWLLYSAVLMAAGIWRKNRGMRVMAILLFGITILKIFIYDLSFLETLYRIFSFLTLGVILIGVSFAYQKYKDIILGESGG